MKLKIAALLLLFAMHRDLAGSYSCTYTCNTDPLQQIYPNQNMCLLLSQIPLALQGLDYVMYPNCDIYNTNRFGYNKRFNVFPNAIIVPQTQEEVQFVLQVLIENNLQFSVRSGGHCYGPGSLSNGYVIDLRNFNTITPDIGSSTVTVGAGCHLGDVIEALGAINYAIPTGTCPSVGVTGLALGGGIGLLARQYGLTSDSIVSITLVTADGNIIEVTQEAYPDLFWALGGAGANAYGIVLGFTFTMYYIPQVSLLQLVWNWDPDQVAQIASAWQEWFPVQSDAITSEIVFVYNNGQLQLKLNALKVGSDPFTEWESTFEPFNPTVNLYQGTYLGAADLFASNYTQPFSKVKSKFTFSPLSQAGIGVIINFMTQLQYLNCPYLLFVEIGGGGGAIEQGDSAYYPRDAFEWIFEFIYWQYEFQSLGALNLIRNIYAILAPYTSEYSYANLVDYDLGASYLDAYYGTNVDRLIQIKNTYDPSNVFTWQQGIPLVYVPESQLTQSIQGKYCTGS
jgi:FAD binding domain/Berberine and berberine like